MKKQLSNKYVKEINDQLKQHYQLENFFDKNDQLFEEHNKNQRCLIKNNEVVFFFQQRWIPTLKLLLKNNILKTIAVDQGAIKFVINGADIMRPGITRIDDGIVKDEIIAVVDAIHKKPLAVGIALLSGDEIKQAINGKMIKNIHYVGDSVWKMGFT